MFGFFSSSKADAPPAPVLPATKKTKKKGFGGFFTGFCGDTDNAIIENKSPKSADDNSAADTGLPWKDEPSGPPISIPPPPLPPPSMLPPPPPPPGEPAVPPKPAQISTQLLAHASTPADGSGSLSTPVADGDKKISTPTEVLSQKLMDNKISLDEFDHMSEQLYASELESSQPNPAWGTPETLPDTLKRPSTDPSTTGRPALTKESQAALQMTWSKKIQRLMDASIEEMNRPGLTNQEKATVAKKWLAVIQKMNRHTQKWLPNLEDHLVAVDVKVAEAEDYKLEHPEPDRTFFIGYDDDY